MCWKSDPEWFQMPKPQDTYIGVCVCSRANVISGTGLISHMHKKYYSYQKDTALSDSTDLKQWHGNGMSLADNSWKCLQLLASERSSLWGLVFILWTPVNPSNGVRLLGEADAVLGWRWRRERRVESSSLKPQAPLPGCGPAQAGHLGARTLSSLCLLSFLIWKMAATFTSYTSHWCPDQKK